MSQPLTLDEVGVSVDDAAQLIYDLRREVNQIRGLLDRCETALVVGARLDAGNCVHSWIPPSCCATCCARAVLAELRADHG